MYNLVIAVSNEYISGISSKKKKIKIQLQLHYSLTYRCKGERIALTQGMNIGKCLLWIKFTVTLQCLNDDHSRI